MKPHPGRIVNFQNGKSQKWEPHTANPEGWFRGEYLHSGYALFTLVNAIDKPLRNAFIKAYNDSGCDAETRVPLIQPMSIRKVGFKLVGRAPSSAGTRIIRLTLLDGSGASAHEIARGEVTIKIVPPNATHDVTFISSIDGSVQYYAIVPPRGPDNGKRGALSFSLHGAAHRQEDARHRSEPHLPDRTFDGRTRDVDNRRAISRPVPRDRSECRVDKLVDMRVP